MVVELVKDKILVNVYDFDHTIYNGDASLDFYFFCIRMHPSLIRFLPNQTWHFILYVLKLENRTEFKSRFFVYLRGLDNSKNEVDKFWHSHFKDIKHWYRDVGKIDDIIISASPDFLLRPAVHLLKVKTLIATRMDSKTGEIKGLNCWGEEKVRRLDEEIGGGSVHAVYSDSKSDMPLLNRAIEPYIVSGSMLMPLQSYSGMPGIKKLWLNVRYKWIGKKQYTNHRQ